MLPEFCPLSYPNNRWACPKTNRLVYKGITEWGPWRVAVRKWADENQEEAFKACQKSPLYFINAFGWTFKPLRSTPEGRMPSLGSSDRPMLTWPIQDKIITEVVDCIEKGQPCQIRKSRDMGATWILLYVFTWYFLFQKDQMFTIVSRVQEDVDKTGDPGTLFHKLRYILKMLPPWMVGEIEDNNMHLRSKRTGSVIDGESTTGDVARGDRRKAILVDEAAAIDMLESILASLSDSTSCPILNSTPKGGTYFSTVGRSGKYRVMTMAWYDHPEKGGSGRFLSKDPATGKVVVDGPWRQAEMAKRPSRRDIAENIDIDEEGAAYSFFDYGPITRQMSVYARFPLYRGDIRYPAEDFADRWLPMVRIDKGKLISGIEFAPDDTHGPLRLWCDLIEDKEGQWRPDQAHTYTLGIDVAGGVDSSNSVITIFDIETGDKVGEFASNTTSVTALADKAVLIGLWFGGRHGSAFMCWENNGRGIEFGRRIRQAGYPWVYQQQDRKGKNPKPTEILGWNSTPTSKPEMLRDYDNALASDRFRNPSTEALEEALRYVYADDGSVDAGDNVGRKGAEKRAHGDRVIADGLAWHASTRLSRNPPPEIPIHPGSMKFRHQKARAQDDEAVRRDETI